MRESQLVLRAHVQAPGIGHDGERTVFEMVEFFVHNFERLGWEKDKGWDGRGMKSGIKTGVKARIKAGEYQR